MVNQLGVRTEKILPKMSYTPTLSFDRLRRGLRLCWMVFACAGVSGCCNQFDHIVRDAYLYFEELDSGRPMDACEEVSHWAWDPWARGSMEAPCFIVGTALGVNANFDRPCRPSFVVGVDCCRRLSDVDIAITGVDGWDLGPVVYPARGSRNSNASRELEATTPGQASIFAEADGRQFDPETLIAVAPASLSFVRRIALEPFGPLPPLVVVGAELRFAVHGYDEAGEPLCGNARVEMEATPPLVVHNEASGSGAEVDPRVNRALYVEAAEAGSPLWLRAGVGGLQIEHRMDVVDVEAIDVLDVEISNLDLQLSASRGADELAGVTFRVENETPELVRLYAVHERVRGDEAVETKGSIVRLLPRDEASGTARVQVLVEGASASPIEVEIHL